MAKTNSRTTKFDDTTRIQDGKAIWLSAMSGSLIAIVVEVGDLFALLAAGRATIYRWIVIIVLFIFFWVAKYKYLTFSNPQRAHAWRLKRIPPITWPIVGGLLSLVGLIALSNPWLRITSLFGLMICGLIVVFMVNPKNKFFRLMCEIYFGIGIGWTAGSVFTTTGDGKFLAFLIVGSMTMAVAGIGKLRTGRI